MRFLRSQTGDTLVEVMIALAVIGVIMGGAYASASQSIRGARAAQERSEAIKVTETQVESLKAMASGYLVPATNIFRVTPFCISGGNQIHDWSSGLTPTANPEDAGALNNYPAACVIDGRYHAVTEYDSSNNDLFTIRVRWERIGGRIDEVRLVYRLHVPQ
jgi:prepilin-type N-terminal cleavage/methylation domain-containing protein